jgi:8-oxo-dGTP diphosphatase
VHEFLGTLVYESGGRSKVVHYWRMETDGGQVYDLTDDVRAVDWLPLDAAVERLSRSYERVFLANVGPLALEAAALARVPRPKAKPRVPAKPRERQAIAPRPSLTIPVPVPPQPDLAPSATLQDDRQSAASDGVETKTSVGPTGSGTAPQIVEADPAVPAPESQSSNNETQGTAQGRSRNLVQRMRDWLRRAA